MFSSVAVIFLQSNRNAVLEKKFTKLMEDIRSFKYNLHTLLLPAGIELLEDTLRTYLVDHDIVIVIGRRTEAVFQTTVRVYDEHWEIAREIQQVKLENADRHFQIIHEEKNQVLWLHRFYFIDCDSIEDDFKQLLKHLEYFKRRPLYSKVYKFEDGNDKIKQYIDCLICCENGIKTTKVKDNEIVVSSTSLEEINTVQSNFIDLAVDSWVIDENEDLIVNSHYSFIQEAIKHIMDCFDKYKPENVFISFNGGKDCTVLLHLMLIILKKYFPDYRQPVFCMYVQSQKPFPQVNDFIDRLKHFYNLDVRTLTLGIKDGLSEILKEKPHLQACLLGTRRMDPFSANLHHFQATDNGWPEIMRVSPLLDWEFAHVWDYLINFKVPYCNLYDEGYTSLGNVDNTVKNPLLFNEDTNEYYPAYKLLTSTKERNGRK